jgi:N-acetylmuramoyl-L-alanine amidase
MKKRNIKYIVIHCTASLSTAAVSTIKNGWKARGWKNPGYHRLIDAQGKAHILSSYANVVNGAKGYNQTGIHIAYIGGVVRSMDYRKLVPADTRTLAQRQTLELFVRELHQLYPNAKIVGHRDLSPDLNKDGVISPNEWTKMCPCFDVKSEYAGVMK